MSKKSEPLFPSEIISIYEKFKNTYPKEKRAEILAECKKLKIPSPPDFGVFAFRMVIYQSKAKPGDKKPTVDYYTWQIQKEKDTWVPVVIKAFKITTWDLPTPEQKKEYPDVLTSCRVSTTFTRDAKDKNGKTIQVTEPYGLARKLNAIAFEWQMQYSIAKKVFEPKNPKICPGIKFTMKNEKKEIVPSPDPFVKSLIPFEKAEKNYLPNGKPKIAIMDMESKERKAKRLAEEKLKKEEKKEKDNGWDFENAALEDSDGNFTIPITYANVHEFITRGSIISGFDSLSSISNSSMGVSNKAKWKLLIVKRARLNKLAQKDISKEDVDNMVDTTITPADDETPKKDEPDADEEAKKDLTDNLEEKEEPEKEEKKAPVKEEKKVPVKEKAPVKEKVPAKDKAPVREEKKVPAKDEKKAPAKEVKKAPKEEPKDEDDKKEETDKKDDEDTNLEEALDKIDETETN
jgi:hypothetical protein